MALTGVGSSTIGRRLMVDPLSLTVTACLRAVDDAGLSLDDIDGLATYPGGHVGGMSEGGVTAVEEALRIRPTWISGGGEFPGPRQRRFGHARCRIWTVPARAVFSHRMGSDAHRAERTGKPRAAAAGPRACSSGERRLAPCPPPTGSA